MNITNLFEMQRQHDAKIESRQQGKDLLPEKILNLIEKVGKLLNVWRGHHIHEEERLRKPLLVCGYCNGEWDWRDEEGKRIGVCAICEGDPNITFPLLTAYVEGLEWVLSIGNDLEMAAEYDTDFGYQSADKTKRHFMLVFDSIHYLAKADAEIIHQRSHWLMLWDRFWLLAASLGLSREQIVAAYTAHIGAKDGESA